MLSVGRIFTQHKTADTFGKDSVSVPQPSVGAEARKFLRGRASSILDYPAGGQGVCSRRLGIMAVAFVLTILLWLTDCRVRGPISGEDLATLFQNLPAGDDAPGIKAILAKTQNARRTDPNWPALAYLNGEAQLRGNHIEQARATFRDISTWAASLPSKGPYKDGWGASGLASVALWRWLQILDAYGGPPAEVDEVLTTAQTLYSTRLFSGMVHVGLLPALPLIEEDGARLLAHVLWKAKRPEVSAAFLSFVSIDSVGEYDAVDNEIARNMFDKGLATPERLDLFRYRRQLGLMLTESNKQRASDALWRLWNNTSAPDDVRAEAIYEWANYYRRSEERKQDVIAGLSSTYELVQRKGLIAERALYLRGMVQNSVKPRNQEAFFADMTRLVVDYPHSTLCDDALYQMAAEQVFSVPPDIDAALSNLAKLRVFAGANDWIDSAYFLAAAALIDRGVDADLTAADRLLADYLENYPDGAFRLRSLFWRARIAEKRNETKVAETLYKQLIHDAPFDYYGLRAGMHLDEGAGATFLATPRTNSGTWARVRNAYLGGKPQPVLQASTVYHARLEAAASAGLYAKLIAIIDSVGKQFRNRLDNIPLQELDKHNLIPAAATLLALRQDALAARDSVLTADNRLRLAGFLGRRVGDWPTVLAMTHLRGDAPHNRITELQNDPRFLASAYPSVEDLTALREPVASAAWQIDGSAALSENLMYAIIRNESGYYPGAISAVGAIGLFQIMPSTFEDTKECWKSYDAAAKPTATSYLFDPARNTQFWSCWINKEKFQPKVGTDIPLMLVKHLAGMGTLGIWMKSWQGRTLEHDLELQIDTFRFPAVQFFVRTVLADTSIADASGIFDAASAAPPRDKP